MATNNKLKAYVRFDGTGRVIAGSLILQRHKPKVGNWKEIDANDQTLMLAPNGAQPLTRRQWESGGRRHRP